MQQLVFNGPPSTGTLDEYTQFEAERQVNGIVKLNCTTRIKDIVLIQNIIALAKQGN